MRSEESREQQLHGAKGETIFCLAQDQWNLPRTSCPAIPPQERNPHQNSPRHCHWNPRKTQSTEKKRGEISRTHRRARGGGGAPLPAAASQDVAAAGVAGRRGPAQGDAAMWTPGGGSQPSKSDSPSSRSASAALLLLPFFSFFPSPESFLVLRIEVRRWSRSSINWRVGDTAPRRARFSFQTCLVFLILLFFLSRVQTDRPVVSSILTLLNSFVNFFIFLNSFFATFGITLWGFTSTLRKIGFLGKCVRL